MNAVFKIRKNSGILWNIRISKNSFYRITIVTAIRTKTAQQLAVDYTEATVEWEQWAVMIGDCDSDTGEDSEAAGD